CLVYNPFVMEHLVVGRGYSLAVAFLTAAIAIGARALASGRDRPAQPYRNGALCSVCIALSFCASFSFAFVDAVVLAFLFFWFARRASNPRERALILAACVAPGLLLTLFLAGSILADWRVISLAWGAKTLTETAKSVISAS